jgi:hypothetical protein
MDGTEEGLDIPEGTWTGLAQNDLPPNVEGVDYSTSPGYEGGEALA